MDFAVLMKIFALLVIGFIRIGVRNACIVIIFTFVQRFFTQGFSPG